MQYSVLYFSLFPFLYCDNLIGTIKSAAVQSGLLSQLRPIYFIMTAFDELGPLSNKVLFTVNFRLSDLLVSQTEAVHAVEYKCFYWRADFLTLFWLQH